MIQSNPIKCPKCGKVVISDEKNLQNLYLTNDIKCICGEIVVYATSQMISW